MAIVFPHYDIDAVLRDNAPKNVILWFHNNMPYGCSNPDPEEALMFLEERVPRDIWQLTTYVPNGFTDMSLNNDNVGDVYRGEIALAQVGAQEALNVVREVIAIFDSFGLGELDAPAGDIYYALKSEQQDLLESQLRDLDQRYVWGDHVWDKLEPGIMQKTYDYVLRNIDTYRRRKILDA